MATGPFTNRTQRGQGQAEAGRRPVGSLPPTPHLHKGLRPQKEDVLQLWHLRGSNSHLLGFSYCNSGMASPAELKISCFTWLTVTAVSSQALH